MFRNRILISIRKAVLEKDYILALWIYGILNYKCGWRDDEIYELVYEQTGIHKNIWNNLLKNN
jgi:hypothetical protein